MPVQHRQQHVETITLKTERDATRIADRPLIDQRLHFDQHWPRTLPRDGNDATRYRCAVARQKQRRRIRSEEHTSELQSLMRISYAVFSSTTHTNLNHTLIIQL